MFKVIVNVYHSNTSIEHIGRFYKDLSNAIRYMKALIYTLDDMQKDGTVMNYDVQLFSGCEEAARC